MVSSRISSWFGTLFVLAFVIITAIQEVYIADYFQKEPPVLVVAITYGITMIVFSLIQISSFQTFQAKVRNHLTTICFLNISTLASFGGIFVALIYLEPAIASMISFAIGPFIGAFFWRWLRPQSPILLTEKIASIGVLGGVLILMFTTVKGKSAVANISQHAALLGLTFAFLSALGAVGSTFLAKRLSERGFMPSAIIAVRFPLLICICLILFIIKTHQIHVSLDHFLFTMLLLSFFTVMLPIFLLQKGLATSEPITVFLIQASTPLFTFAFQFLDTRLHPSILTFVGIGLGFFSSIFGTLSRQYKETMKKAKSK